MTDILYQYLKSTDHSILDLVCIFSRASGLIWVIGWLVGGQLGVRPRLLIALVLTIAAYPVVSSYSSLKTQLDGLMFQVVQEVLIGAILGLGAGLVVAAARMAGEIIGGMTGFSAVSTLVPGSGALTPLAGLAGLVGIATFVIIDGPLRLLLVFLDSYSLTASSSFDSSKPESITTSFKLLDQALSLSLRLAFPVVFVMMSIQVASTLLARASTSPFGFTAWLPVRNGIGILLVLLGIGGFARLLALAWSTFLPLS